MASALSVKELPTDSSFDVGLRRGTSRVPARGNPLLYIQATAIQMKHRQARGENGSDSQIPLRLFCSRTLPVHFHTINMGQLKQLLERSTDDVLAEAGLPPMEVLMTYCREQFDEQCSDC